MDEGVVAVQLSESLSLEIGKMYTPFSVYNSHFISDPQTLELGETNESAVLLKYANDFLELSVGAFNGSFDEVGKDNRIDDFTAHLAVEF